MARGTNLFFNNFTNTDEQNLINDLVYESIKIYGIDVGYMSFTEDDTDDVLNESRKKYYNNYSLVEVYIRNVDGFEGEGDFLSKFGVEIRDRVTFSIALLSWGISIFIGLFLAFGSSYSVSQIIGIPKLAAKSLRLIFDFLLFLEIVRHARLSSPVGQLL